jgi:hypothetical protein
MRRKSQDASQPTGCSTLLAKPIQPPAGSIRSLLQIVCQKNIPFTAPILIKPCDALSFMPQPLATKAMNIRLLILFSLVSALPLRLIAGSDPFIGAWRLRPDRSRFFGVQEKIEDLGGYKYRFTTGDRVETIVLDGEDHPSANGKGATWALRKIGPNKWKSIDKVNGQITAISIWTVSDDGRIFTAATQGIRNDGTRYKTKFTATRVAGTSGLIGTWVGAGPDAHAPVHWSIEPFEGDGLSLISRDSGERVDLKFDGKDYPETGPGVPAGSTVSAGRVDERTIELFDRINGKLAYVERLQVSPDGTVLALGIGESSAKLSAVYYYDRQ